MDRHATADSSSELSLLLVVVPCFNEEAVHRGWTSRRQDAGCGPLGTHAAGHPHHLCRGGSTLRRDAAGDLAAAFRRGRLDALGLLRGGTNGREPEQVGRIYRGLGQERRTSRYLPLEPLLAQPIPEVSA